MVCALLEAAFFGFQSPGQPRMGRIQPQRINQIFRTTACDRVTRAHARPPYLTR
ncbi:hypothetical protein KNP414_04382 [Paenibacillus mucilaginosus KNP414]|uniref:Uncharacterized protein n=1 Tax=Paenibacillus mucilaginosus (strain KNP414) TaxID=1036673 RepID=F8F6G0_PAEMK|nr:hypothetical protein KNP414_04382 [Paenibacillus mucilaginosus KNP414]